MWKRTPSLYLAMHGEVVRQTVSRYGPAPDDDCRRKEVCEQSPHAIFTPQRVLA